MNLLKITLTSLLVAGLNAAMAADIYVAQNTTGAGDGSTAADCKPVTWLNNATPNPGDTIHLVGVITNEIAINGSGTAGNVITYYFEPGAKLTQTAGTLIFCPSKNYLVIDGGVNGILENTDNGVGMGHSIAISGIYASACSHFEVKNLTIQNLYVHPPQASTSSQPFVDFGANGALYMNGFGDGISIHNNNFSNICWVINMGNGNGNGVNIYSNSFVNYDHGATSFGNSASNIRIYNNHFGSTATWDTGIPNYYHHDGIHLFFGAGASVNGMQIYNNLFDGDWGNNNTAHIFCEGDYTHANPNSISNVMIYNNVFLQWTTNKINNGFLAGGGPNWSIYNNTFVGASVYNSCGLSISGSNLKVQNNIFTGLNTFISVGGTNACIFNNNVYSKSGPGGNYPWSRAAGIPTFGAWQKSIGSDSNSIVTSLAVVDANGGLLTNSYALGSGADLSAIFQTDVTGATRTTPWSAGAYQSAAGSGNVLSPPQNLHVVR